jgi:transposase-like protein
MFLMLGPIKILVPFVDIAQGADPVFRRTLVVRIFPNTHSCLRLVRALAVEIHESWLEATRYPNMDHLREHKKENLRALAA